MRSLFLLALVFFTGCPLAGGHPCIAGENPPDSGVPILLYHRFGSVLDSMTVKTTVFEAQLKHIQDHAYRIIPLRQLVNYRLGKGPPPPPRSVIITADDGHKSVVREMLPLLRKYRAPATLFIYPSALSNAGYAMTWEEIRGLKATGLIDLQSHTFWHPNFKVEKRRLTREAYQDFVKGQLRKSKEIIEKNTGSQVEMLAWPFGIHDDELAHCAMEMGYTAAFTMERRRVFPSDDLLKLPRYLMVHSDRHLLPF